MVEEYYNVSGVKTAYKDLSPTVQKAIQKTEQKTTTTQQEVQQQFVQTSKWYDQDYKVVVGGKQVSVPGRYLENFGFARPDKPKEEKKKKDEDDFYLNVHDERGKTSYSMLKPQEKVNVVKAVSPIELWKHGIEAPITNVAYRVNVPTGSGYQTRGSYFLKSEMEKFLETGNVENINNMLKYRYNIEGARSAFKEREHFYALGLKHISLEGARQLSPDYPEWAKKKMQYSAARRNTELLLASRREPQTVKGTLGATWDQRMGNTQTTKQVHGAFLETGNWYLEINGKKKEFATKQAADEYAKRTVTIGDKSRTFQTQEAAQEYWNRVNKDEFTGLVGRDFYHKNKFVSSIPFLGVPEPQQSKFNELISSTYKNIDDTSARLQERAKKGDVIAIGSQALFFPVESAKTVLGGVATFVNLFEKHADPVIKKTFGIKSKEVAPITLQGRTSDDVIFPYDFAENKVKTFEQITTDSKEFIEKYGVSAYVAGIATAYAPIGAGTGNISLKVPTLTKAVLKTEMKIERLLGRKYDIRGSYKPNRLQAFEQRLQIYQSQKVGLGLKVPTFGRAAAKASDFVSSKLNIRRSILDPKSGGWIGTRTEQFERKLKWHQLDPVSKVQYLRGLQHVGYDPDRYSMPKKRIIQPTGKIADDMFVKQTSKDMTETQKIPYNAERISRSNDLPRKGSNKFGRGTSIDYEELFSKDKPPSNYHAFIGESKSIGGQFQGTRISLGKGYVRRIHGDFSSGSKFSRDPRHPTNLDEVYKSRFTDEEIKRLTKAGWTYDPLTDSFNNAKMERDNWNVKGGLNEENKGRSSSTILIKKPVEKPKPIIFKSYPIQLGIGKVTILKKQTPKQTPKQVTDYLKSQSVYERNKKKVIVDTLYNQQTEQSFVYEHSFAQAVKQAQLLKSRQQQKYVFAQPLTQRQTQKQLERSKLKSRYVFEIPIISYKQAQKQTPKQVLKTRTKLVPKQIPLLRTIEEVTFKDPPRPPKEPPIPKLPPTEKPTTTKPPIPFMLNMKRPKRTKKGKKVPREDFLGSTHEAAILGFRTTKTDITYGDAKTARLARKDLLKVTKSRGDTKFKQKGKSRIGKGQVKAKKEKYKGKFENAVQKRFIKKFF